jgi:hypothetical protein
MHTRKDKGATHEIAKLPVVAGIFFSNLGAAARYALD